MITAGALAAGAIVETGTLLKVVLLSAASGLGIAVVFGAGVASVGSLLDARREGRRGAEALWSALAMLCLVAAIAAVALGLVAMSAKR